MYIYIYIPRRARKNTRQTFPPGFFVGLCSLVFSLGCYCQTRKFNTKYQKSRQMLIPIRFLVHLYGSWMHDLHVLALC